MGLQGRHRRRRTASSCDDVGRRGGCRACMFEAIHARRMSGIGLARLGWIPASGSDVLTRRPRRSHRNKQAENPGLSSDVGILCCIPNAWALLACNRSPFAPRIRRAGRTQKPLLRPTPSLASPCEGVVRERRLEFSDSVDAAGMGPSPAPYLPERNERTLLANDGRASPWSRPSVGRRAHAARGVRR